MTQLQYTYSSFRPLQAEKHISLDESSDVILEQDNPNPFSESSTITYYIPEQVQGNPKLLITLASAMNDVLLSIDLAKGTPLQLTIDATDLKTGVYVYSIVIDGKVAATKKMIIIK